MRSLPRILLGAAWVMSLVLTLAAVGLWVRSYRVADAWGWSAEKRADQCGIALGRLRLDRTALAEEGGSWNANFTHISYRPEIDPPNRRLPATPRNLGFAAEHTVMAGNYESWLIMVPFWFICLALASGGVLFRRLARRALRRERRRKGLCAQCGYDLHATPHYCPECGAIPR